MEPIKGSPIFVGHRAYGSMLGNIFLIFLVIALIFYLHFDYPSYLSYVLFVYHGISVNVLDALLFLAFILILIVYIRHREYTYIITSQQVYVRHGIISANVRNFTYNQVQEASSFQTVGQRILLWGQLNITMLITLTGQSKVEEAHMDFVHRPKKIASMMIQRVSIGEK